MEALQFAGNQRGLSSVVVQSQYDRVHRFAHGKQHPLVRTHLAERIPSIVF